MSIDALGRQLLAIRAQVDAALACFECMTGAQSQASTRTSAQASTQRDDESDPTDMLPRVFGGYAGQSAASTASGVIPLHPSQGEGAA